MEDLSIRHEDIIFNEDGTLTITNKNFRNEIEKLNTEAELIRVVRKDSQDKTSSDGINFSCGNINAICAQTVFEKTDYTFVQEDQVNISNTQFITDISKQLSEKESAKIRIGIKGYKPI
jgi:hypothetical protein